MPNYSLQVNQIEVDGCNKEMFRSFLEMDGDFNENEECFREDTLELGFENEAQRCSHELFKKYEKDFYKGEYIDVLEKVLEEAGHMCGGGSQHIYGNGTYTAQSELTVICLDEHENNYVVVVSMMSY